MKLTNNNREAGNAIILVMSILAVLVVIIAVSAEYTTTINRHVQRTNNLQAAVAIADGAIENQFSYWREICRINTTQAMPTSYMQYIPVPTQAQFPNIPNFTAKAGTLANLTDEYDANYTVSNLKVVAVDPQFQPLPSASATPNPGIGMSGNDATFNYVALADVTLPVVRGKVVARVRRIFQKQQYSPWTYAIFYVDPLEIHPGPAFTVTGPVHTNADLFTGHSSLTFADKVTYARDWTIGFMPGDGTHPETPTKPNWASGLPPALDIAHQPFGLDSTRIFNPTDSNPNNDSYHELVEPPDTTQTDPLVGQRYYDQADIIVTVNASNAITYARSNGDGTVTALTNTSSGNDKKLYDLINGAITTNQVLQDNREGAQVRLATLDLSKIRKPKNDGWKGDPVFNGVIYLRDSSGTSTTHRGFRLQNGQYIPQGGLTIASPNPVYIQGDFNTGKNPPSNTGTPTDPDGDMSGAGGTTSQAYVRQPCSVIADAVNILSNNWSDSNLLTGVTARLASPTTINTAIVSGIVPSGTPNGTYSGGAENFPRFLEDWSPGGVQKTLTYYGSMVELYKSTQSVGTWGKGNVYEPPDRKWYFDTNFKISAPPGSLMVYSYIKGQWSMQ
jgi:hypothetical protein